MREYVVWRVEENAIDWFVLHRGKYQPLPPAKVGLLQSKIFPGLWLDAVSLLAGQLPQMLEVAKLGVASEAHATFAEKLRARKG